MPDTTTARQNRLQIRATTKWLHTWGGIVLGGIVSLVCLTGSVIMFRREVERARWPQSSAVTRASHHWSLDAAAPEIERVQPSSSITRVTFPADPNVPYVFQIKSV